MNLQHSRQDGFTLIEIMVVLVIIGIIALLIVPNVLSRPDDARVTVAKSQIESISNAVELYKLDNNVYPSTQQGLAALVKKPTDAPEPKNWRQPYLKAIPQDPWGNPYQYLSPGVTNAYDILSFGADGKIGGDGYNKDISN